MLSKQIATLGSITIGVIILASSLLLRRRKPSCRPVPLLGADEITVGDKEDIDAPGLSNRVLRKAETVIRGRTSRIIIVIERCTDDHNYTAIIRTAEALGIQHIWLVDPVISATDSPGGSLAPRRSQFMGVTWHEKELKWVAQLTSGGHTIPLGKFDKEDDAARSYDVAAGVAVNFPDAEDENEYDANHDEHGMFARMAAEWVTLREFKSTRDCINALRADR
jgi:hypothetical protein